MTIGFIDEVHLIDIVSDLIQKRKVRKGFEDRIISLTESPVAKSCFCARKRVRPHFSWGLEHFSA